MDEKKYTLHVYKLNKQTNKFDTIAEIANLNQQNADDLRMHIDGPIFTAAVIRQQTGNVESYPTLGER